MPARTLLMAQPAAGGGSWDGNFVDGLSAFVTAYSPHTAFSLNNTNTNSGTDTETFTGGVYDQAATSQFSNYGLADDVAPGGGSDWDNNIMVDACLMLYLPAATGRSSGRYLVSNGGGTHGQLGYCWEDGSDWFLGICQRSSDSLDEMESSTALAGESWYCVGFQWHDNAGNWAIWVDGAEDTTAAKTLDMLQGAGDPRIGETVGVNPTRSLIRIGDISPDPLIANLVVEGGVTSITNSTDTTSGQGDSWYTDYFAEHQT